MAKNLLGKKNELDVGLNAVWDKQNMRHPYLCFPEASNPAEAIRLKNN